MNVRFLGLDLAWSDRNPSGLAVLDGEGTLLDLRADLHSDAEILAWVRAHLGTCGVLGIDMPTIVNNQTGSRDCEKDVARDFQRFNAAPHPANRGRPLFRDGGRARRLIDDLQADGVVEYLNVTPRDQRNIALEVFPHPAHVKLFGLDRIFKYKKKGSRSWADVVGEWNRYRAHLTTLRDAVPPLHLAEDRVPLTLAATDMSAKDYKAWDDGLDAITCAYIASYVWHWGLDGDHVRAYGDLAGGYIVVPNRSAFA
jgi:predicted RNase H-like nuclease